MSDLTDVALVELIILSLNSYLNIFVHIIPRIVPRGVVLKKKWVTPYADTRPELTHTLALVRWPWLTSLYN